MDTKFWGPDGWKLLHSITVTYPDNPNRDIKSLYSTFFNSISHVLPCIYCRISFAEYIEELPVDGYLNNSKDLSKWLYLIHNKVNEKLRKQKLNLKKNPKPDIIHRRYVKYVNDVNNNRKSAPGFDFLYSIVFNFTYTRDKIKSYRIEQYEIFFTLLGLILPFKLLKEIYVSHIVKNVLILKKQCNHSLKLWLHQLELTYKMYIDDNCLCFKKTCMNIEQYKVGCKNNTCRKSK
jgi:hypothetical protein